MKTVQLRRNIDTDWQYLGENIPLSKPLVLVFGNRYLLESNKIYQEIKEIFNDGEIVFGSSAGDISSHSVDDDGITITAIEFEKSSFAIKTVNVKDDNQFVNSYEAGYALIQQFDKENLKYVLVISDGSVINGSQLANGMNKVTNNDILITGALCSDAARFEKTICSYNENPKSGEIVAIGLYGEHLEISFAINDGWTPFGPERIVTKSKDNILYELDHKPALDLYKKYLGEKSKELPAAALLFPLKVKSSNEQESIVRTILNINEKDNSMILAGDIAENSTVQLMMTNVDSIINAAEIAANKANHQREKSPELAILVSCIGRKLVLDQRVEEEVDEVVEVVGNKTTICGLYSYGEIAPFNGENNCQLHNQTMTITLISEK
ncbi:FIST C-terminal domain-containing protein [Polaribacter sp. BAL334]|jgi:hypothetical protein|uniref:FIST signal transduction protein n=1 Tax=Polaribacter sp. BAL334 TaxID=1708178 RepID=UPI0018D24D52|nr:FIST N-terminal domain-containing protein [Polaribacter sp. BAL334]MBG7612894.1 FIST C-terminal domain-containing protein [Polaribacter sp. BAL334]